MAKKKVLSPHKPARIRDLKPLCDRLGLMVSDYCAVLGLSSNKWSKWTRLPPDMPIPDPTTALLMRALDDHPEFCLFHNWPTPDSVQRLVDAVLYEDPWGGVNNKSFGIALGRDQTAGSRWLRAERPAGRFVTRTLYVLHRTLAAQGRKGWDAWLDRVELERTHADRL